MRIRRKIVRDSRVAQIKRALDALTLSQDCTNDFARLLARTFVSNACTRISKQLAKRNAIARNTRRIKQLEQQLHAA